MGHTQFNINRIKDILRRDYGINSSVDYTEQISWILLLKFLNDFEETIESRTKLNYNEYKQIFPIELRRRIFNKNLEDNFYYKSDNYVDDTNLLDFVNNYLFNFLKEFIYVSDKDSLEYAIGCIFKVLKNKITSEHNLKEILELFNSLDLSSENGLVDARQIYETLLKDLGSESGKYGGFYTPRPVIQTMVKTINPEIKESIYDGALGSAGFLVEAFEYIKNQNNKPQNSEWRSLQNNNFYGRELSPMGYAFGMVNMILHGILHPHILNEDTLASNAKSSNIKRHYDIILSNPPMGRIQYIEGYDLPVLTNSMGLLYLQHYMMSLRSGGRAAIIVPNGVLFDSSLASKKIKQTLLENFNLHTILNLPNGIFLPYSGVNASIIYFDRTGSTSKIWYYELIAPYTFTKNKPIQNEHFEEFIDLYLNPTTRNCSNTIKNNHPNDWTVSVDEIVEFNLDAKNPNKYDLAHLEPKDFLNKLKENSLRTQNNFSEIEQLTVKLVNNKFAKLNWEEVSIFELVEKVKSNDKLFNNDVATYIDASTIHTTKKIIEQPKTMSLEDLPQRGKKGAMKGDVIFSTIRPEQKNIAIIKEEYNSLILSTTFCILRPKREKLRSDFLFYFLLSDKFQRQINRLTKGTSIPSISEKDLLSIKIPLPTLERQLEIAENLREFHEKIEMKIDIESEMIANLKLLKESMLQEIFNGNPKNQ